MNSIECVIFDWAGTTIDFGSLSPVAAFQKAFETFGVAVTLEQTRAPMGQLKIDHIRAMLQMPDVANAWEKAQGARPTPADAQRIYEAFEPALMAVLANHCAPKPYVLECVTQLRHQGIRVGSTTGFTRKMMDVVIPTAAQAGYQVDACVTADEVGGFGRPWPYMLFENMKLLKVSSVRRVVKVGDTISDIQEALAAGVTAVGVIEGSSIMGLTQAQWDATPEAERVLLRQAVKDQMMAAGAHYTIDNLASLIPLIETIKQR